jgi:hypothetical protein
MEVSGTLLIFLGVVAAFLFLGLPLLGAILWVWIGILRERRAVERCIRLHGSAAKGKIDEL